MPEEVTWEDQQQINKFSRLNSRLIFLKSLCKSRQTNMEYYQDAVNELELMDDEELVKYKIGDTFVNLSVESARKRLHESIEIFNKEQRENEEELLTLKQDMDVLKGSLYAKFKNSINLEYDDNE